jgi:hypothetical protein
MTKMTISVPDALRKRMKKYELITNWSNIAAKAFETSLISYETPEQVKTSVVYASEKLTNAVNMLLSAGSIQDRLHGAFIYSLIHVPVQAIPDEVRPEFEEMLKACVRKKGAKEMGAASASILAMPDEEAARYAHTVARAEDLVEKRLWQLFPR